MKLLRHSTLALVAFFLVACGSSNSESISLKLNLQKGNKHTITTGMETSMGALMSVKMETAMSFEVTDVVGNGEAFAFNTKVLSIKSNTKSGDDVESYDSNKPVSEMSFDESSMHSEFEDVLNSTLTLSIGQNGEITEPFSINGTPLPSDPIDMSNVQLIFPDEALQEGSTWSHETTNPLVGTKRNSTYTLRKIGDSELTISVDAKGGITGDQKINGEYILDRQTGLLKKGHLTMKLMNGGSVTYSMKGG